MPAVSGREQRAAGADAGRCEKGQKPRTFPSCDVAREFAHTAAGKRATKGSPPFGERELRQGFRRLG